jgi:hypothetical protein
MKLEMKNGAQQGPQAYSGRCPHCRKESILSPIGVNDIHVDGVHVVGQRQCPNPECRGHIFIVAEKGRIVEAYPPMRIDFDKENIPANVLTSFEEAVACHATSCFIASAIMVRRTLEEICVDKQAGGANLKERIKALESKIVVPKELIEAMDELRLLGNDAAHIEAQTYAKISAEELVIAIEFTKELLKALYQYTGLLGRLRALKKTPTP